jgi:hypothetical protein
MCEHPEKFLMGYRAHRGSVRKGRGAVKKDSKSIIKEFSDEDLGISPGEDIV